MTTSVAQTVKSVTILIGVFIIMFLYSWKLTLVVIASNFPLIFFSRLSFWATRSWSEQLQKAKAQMCSYAEETLSNVRTVKAFSDEKQCVLRYNEESRNVYMWGDKMAKIWGFFMGQNQILGAGSLAIVCYAGSVSFQKKEIDIGTITAFLLYMRNFQEITINISNQLQNMSKIHGAAYDISVMIVTPNKLQYDGTKVMGEDTDDEDLTHPIMQLEKVEFHYPSKPEVKVLQGVDIDVMQN